MIVIGLFVMVACVGAIFLAYKKSAEKYNNR